MLYLMIDDYYKLETTVFQQSASVASTYKYLLFITVVLVKWYTVYIIPLRIYFNGVNVTYTMVYM